MSDVLNSYFMEQVKARAEAEPENPMGEGVGGIFLDSIVDEMLEAGLADSIADAMPKPDSVLWMEHESLAATVAAAAAKDLSNLVAALCQGWAEWVEKEIHTPNLEEMKRLVDRARQCDVSRIDGASAACGQCRGCQTLLVMAEALG